MKTVRAYHHPPALQAVPGPTFRPHVFIGLWCQCGARHHQSAHYYVTCRRDNGDVALLAGPYSEHHEALAILPRVTALAYESGDPHAPWYSYGTMAYQPTVIRPGVLNTKLNALTPEPVRRPRHRARGGTT